MTTSHDHVPDILDSLAQLSNSAVPTPPRLAREMLDLLPKAVWTEPDYRWLEPCSKSGVFLKEVAARLLDGLAEWEPDFNKRRDHIFRNMLFGTSITEITGQVSRRSLYYSRDASSNHAVVRFETPDGNLPFVYADHNFSGEKSPCKTCRAPRKYERGESRENYAYSFIHGTYPTEEMDNVKFDVIVGNPPYHFEDDGYGASATPVFHRFVEQAMAMNPRYLVMITPSRWFHGGKGLEKFRERMLKDKRVRALVDYPKLYDAFPGVKIRGGVSYFLWARDHDGLCTVQTMWDGVAVGDAVARDLGEFDVVVRWNKAVSILEKVQAFLVDDQHEPTLDAKVSAMKPFGLRTYFHGNETRRGLKDPVLLYGSKKQTWVSRSQIPQNEEWIDDWKVLMSRVQGTSARVEYQYLGRPIVSEPGTACTETYVVAGRFESKNQAERYAAYLRTRFARFLVSLRKSTQDAARDVYAFIPEVPLDRIWTDEALYRRYGIDDEEIEFIESHVRDMPGDVA